MRKRCVPGSLSPKSLGTRLVIQWSHICSYHMTLRHGALVSIVYNVPQIAQLVYHSYSVLLVLSLLGWLARRRDCHVLLLLYFF